MRPHLNPPLKGEENLILGEAGGSLEAVQGEESNPLSYNEGFETCLQTSFRREALAVMPDVIRHPGFKKMN
jgi:hypothetical protein